ncbi:hypothetical protein QQ045_006514 [Rhodiola kirilowii]
MASSPYFTTTLAATFKPTTNPHLKPSPTSHFHSFFKPSLIFQKKGAAFTPIRAALSRRPEYIPNRIDDPNYVRIFDTTLRDGEQSPGATMTLKQKLDIARQLAKLGVDVIEAGFPASSPVDFKAVETIAKEVGNRVDEDGYVPVICGLARCNKDDILASWEAVKHAKRPRIHVFIATSNIHLEHKLRKTKDQVLQIATSMVTYAKSLGCEDIEFSAEDAGRTDKKYLYRVLEEVIKVGATTVNIPDTVGYLLSREYAEYITDIKANTTGIENVVISTHCQNDLGLATINSIEGAFAGARQLECTLNGIGERAGNASLEEIVMILKTRGKEAVGGLFTAIDTRHIYMTSKMVEEYSGLLIQPHKAIVGANAFAHESGIHQDGMLKNKATYEIMEPADIGLERTNTAGISLGKLSGRSAVKEKLKELGYEVTNEDMKAIFPRFKSVAEQKKHVTDADLVALVSDELFNPEIYWQLSDLQVTCGSLGLSTATVKLTDADGKEHIACSVGTGPVDCAYKAIDLIVKAPATLLEYSMNAVTEGIDAIATTRVLIRCDSNTIATNVVTGQKTYRTFSGTGAAMDITVSSVRAYIGALNKLISFDKDSAVKGSTHSLPRLINTENSSEA